MDIDNKLSSLLSSNSLKELNNLKKLVLALNQKVYLVEDLLISEDKVNEVNKVIGEIFSELYQEGKGNVTPKDIKDLLDKSVVGVAERIKYDYKEKGVS